LGISFGVVCVALDVTKSCGRIGTHFEYVFLLIVHRRLGFFVEAGIFGLLPKFENERRVSVQSVASHTPDWASDAAFISRALLVHGPWTTVWPGNGRYSASRTKERMGTVSHITLTRISRSNSPWLLLSVDCWNRKDPADFYPVDPL
jgi:hypothetical protein